MNKLFVVCYFKNVFIYILVGVFNCFSDLFEGDVVRGEFVWVEIDLVFMLEFIDGGYFGDFFNCF